MNLFRNRILALTLMAWVACNVSVFVMAQEADSTKATAKDRPPPEFEEDESKKAKIEKPPVLPPAPPSVNPETLRMIEIIERKNRELKRKEEEMTLREKNLKTLEAKISEDLRKIEDALAKSQEQVGIKKDLIEKNVNNLVKVYSAMKPDEAARLLESLDEGVAIQIISKMKSKVAGQVMGRMKTPIAKNISEKIAGKRIDKQKEAMKN